MGPGRCCLKSILISQQGTSAMQRIVGSADSTIWKKKTLDDNLALLVALLWPPFPSRFSPLFPVFCLLSSLFASVTSVCVPLDYTNCVRSRFLVIEGIKKWFGSLLGGHQKIISGHESNIKPQRWKLINSSLCAGDRTACTLRLYLRSFPRLLGVIIECASLGQNELQVCERHN